MGELAELTVKQKYETMSFACEIIESVEEDNVFPILGLSDDVAFKIVAMAQMLVASVNLTTPIQSESK